MTQDISLRDIQPDPQQPRKHFDETKLQELAASMAADGLLSPIMVRPEGDKLIIVHGERRYRAALLLGWETIPATVQEISADRARVLALVENIQRSNLTPIEEARAFQSIMETQGLTHDELAKTIGKSRSYVTQKMRLLKLPSHLSYFMEKGILSEGHIRQLLRLKKLYPDGKKENVSPDTFSSVTDAMIQLRPLDWPPNYKITVGLAYMAAKEEKEGAVAPEYPHHGDKVLSTFPHDGIVDAWTIPAWWFAMQFSLFRLKREEAKEAIDTFEMHIASAILTLAFPDILKTDDAGRPVADWPDCLNAYRSDLRHAGLPRANDPKRTSWAFQRLQTNDGLAFVVPSKKAWGPWVSRASDGENYKTNKSEVTP